MTDFIPDAQTLLTVVAGVQTGKPAPRADCLAGACPSPACITLPMYTSFTSSGGIPALSMAAFMEIEPSCGAVNEERHPLKEPMGVLAALTMTTSYDEREN